MKFVILFLLTEILLLIVSYLRLKNKNYFDLSLRSFKYSDYLLH